MLAGHSFSGMIVTEAGVHPHVSALVYVAARAPDAGEDYAALAARYPTPPASAGIVYDGDEGRLTEKAFLRDFAGDLPATKARALFAVQQPFRKALLAGRVSQAAWRSKPRFYAVSTQDRTINPDLQRYMAARMGARTVEPRLAHLPSPRGRRADFGGGGTVIAAAFSRQRSGRGRQTMPGERRKEQSRSGRSNVGFPARPARPFLARLSQ